MPCQRLRVVEVRQRVVLADVFPLPVAIPARQLIADVRDALAVEGVFRSSSSAEKGVTDNFRVERWLTDEVVED